MRWLRVALPAGAFVALAVVVAIWPDNALDRAATETLQRATALDGVFFVASWFGNHLIDLIVPAVLFAGLLALRWWREAAAFAVSVIGTAMLDTVTKWIVDRPRPGSPVHVLYHVTGSSYPSGHVTQYSAMFGVLAVIAAHRIARPWPRRTAVAACAILLVAVGPSRIYMGAHWLTDVIGGYLLGLAWVGTVTNFYKTR
jgi:undecaprenyl-diphosphatase